MPRLNRFVLARTLTVALLGIGPSSWGQAQPASPSSAGADREDAAVRRFHAVLERTPRRGTALDRVYGHHIERGSLDGLVDTYRRRAETDPKDGAAHMLVGLLEAQRGHDGAAVAAFRAAEAARP